MNEHVSNPDCYCRPVYCDGVWVHRSDDGKEYDEPGHEVALTGMDVEYIVLFAYYMHAIGKYRAIELLDISPQWFEIRLQQFLKTLSAQYKSAERFLDDPAFILGKP